MQRLPPPRGHAKNSASILSPAPVEPEDSPASPAEESSPISRRPFLLVDPEPPHFKPPKNLSLPPDIPPFDPNRRDSYTTALYRTAARRAANTLRAHLQGIPHQEIWMFTIDLEGTLTGSSCVAKGGLDRLQITLPDLLVRARSLGARGLVLLQNRPGSPHDGTPIDAELSIKVDLICNLLGIPLVDHVYIDPKGRAFFVRERGILKGTAALRRAIDERIAYLAAQEHGVGGKGEGERESAEVPPPEEPLVYRRRGPRKP